MILVQADAKYNKKKMILLTMARGSNFVNNVQVSFTTAY
jgi:hypothetical protein